MCIRDSRNTAEPIAGPAADGFGQGPGLLQVDRAWEYLARHAASVGETLPIEVRVGGGRGRRGIYLRDAHETARPASRLVQLTPRFPENHDNSARVAFQLNLALKPSAKWIDCGKQLLLTHGGGSFRVTVDPNGLQPGAHRGEVLVLDSDQPDRGPLARVPITVIKPHPTTARASWQSVVPFHPGTLASRFLAVLRGGSRGPTGGATRAAPWRNAGPNPWKRGPRGLGTRS